MVQGLVRVQGSGLAAMGRVLLVSALLTLGLSCGACRSGPASAERATQMAASDAADQGVAHVRLGNPQAALAEFERAIELNPLMARAYVGAGDQYLLLQDPQKAEERYRQATRLDPNNPRVHYKLGRSLQIMGRLSESIQAYLVALRLDPSDALANMNVSVAYMQAEEPRLARPFAERAVYISPNAAAARINLGSVYAALGEHRRAVDEYQQAAELVDPISPELLVNLAESLRNLGEDAQVVNVLDQLLRTSESALAWERRGSALFRLRDYEAAMTSYARALELDPQHYPALNGMGVYRLNQYIWSGQTDTSALSEALEHFRKSLQIEHRQPRIRELVSRFG